jgi:SHS2 domain-containing protein
VQPFEVLDHTADLSIRAHGRDLRELVENAAAGLLALLYAGPPPPATGTRDLAVAADRPEFVLQRALRELLYLMEDEGLAPVSVEVLTAGETSATLRAGAVPLEDARPYLGAEIKAVTRHGLEITHEPDGLSITLVFDV